MFPETRLPMVGNQQIVRAPKRLIQRRRSLVVINGLVNVINANILHTVTEKKTLTRTRITGSVVYSGAAASPYAVMAAHIKRNGKQVIDTISVAETLDQVEPLASILRDVIRGGQRTEVGANIPTEINIDTKAQRKLDPGDIIELGMLSSSATGEFDIALEITQWFKLA